MTKRYIDVEDTRIAVFEEGTGKETVLMVHGYVGSHSTWRHQMTTLSDSFRIISVDWVGWGESERNPKLDYSHSKEVERVHRLVQVLDLAPFHFVGNDYGGVLGLGYAHRHEEQLKTLSLINTRANGQFRPIWHGVFEIMRHMANYKSTRFYELFPWFLLHRSGIQNEILRGTFTRALAHEYCGWMKTREGKLFLRAFYRGYNPKLPADVEQGLSHISLKTLILWGRRDVYLAPWVARNLARLLPNAELKLYPRGGHFLSEQLPDEVSADLRSFILANL